jgi:hypothetical protein
MQNTILIAMVVANLAITIILWKKISGILSLVRTPLVKKLTPELNLRPIRKSVLAGGDNQRKNPRGNQSSNNQAQADVGSPQNPMRRPGEEKNNRPERGDRNDRSERNDRNDRGGDRNNKRFNNRNKTNRPRPSTPSELYSNDSAPSSDFVAGDDYASRNQRPDIAPQAYAENVTSSERPIVQHDVVQNAAPTSRPPLPQRGAGAAEQAPMQEAPAQHLQADYNQPANATQNSAEERTIRHGRRTQVKKTPVFEAESTENPA